ANQTQEAEEEGDDGGHAQESHGWTSLIGAIMLHSDPAGRDQTMSDQALSTLARHARAECHRGVRRQGGVGGAPHQPPRRQTISAASPGPPLESDRELYGRLAQETGRRTLVDRFVVPRRSG